MLKRGSARRDRFGAREAFVENCGTVARNCELPIVLWR